MSGYQNVSLRLGYGSVDHDDHPTFTNLGRVFQFFDILFKSRFNSTSYECFIRINSSLFHSFLVNTFQSRV